MNNIQFDLGIDPDDITPISESLQQSYEEEDYEVEELIIEIQAKYFSIWKQNT